LAGQVIQLKFAFGQLLSYLFQGERPALVLASGNVDLHTDKIATLPIL